MYILFLYYFVLISSFIFESWMGVYSFLPKKVTLQTDPPSFAMVGRLPFYMFENTGETFNLFSSPRPITSRLKGIPTFDSVFHDVLAILFTCYFVGWFFKAVLLMFSFSGVICKKKILIDEEEISEQETQGEVEGETTLEVPQGVKAPKAQRRPYFLIRRYSLLFRLRVSIIALLYATLLDLFYLFIHFSCSFHTGYHTSDGYFVVVAPGALSGVWFWMAMTSLDILALLFLVQFYRGFVEQYEHNLVDAFGYPVQGKDNTFIVNQIKEQQLAFQIARESSLKSSVNSNGFSMSEEEILQKKLSNRSMQVASEADLRQFIYRGGSKSSLSCAVKGFNEETSLELAT